MLLGKSLFITILLVKYGSFRACSMVQDSAFSLSGLILCCTGHEACFASATSIFCHQVQRDSVQKLDLAPLRGYHNHHPSSSAYAVPEHCIGTECDNLCSSVSSSFDAQVSATFCGHAFLWSTSVISLHSPSGKTCRYNRHSKLMFLFHCITTLEWFSMISCRQALIQCVSLGH